MTDTGAMEERYTEDEIEAGRLLFAGPADFVLGVASLSQLPAADRPEIAFAGRSNVGKSSLINAVTGRKQLARTSNTPGRTQQLNFFDLAEGRLYLVDLPGYGFAEAPKKNVDAWSRLTMDYLRGRPSLKRIFMLVDARHGPNKTDLAIMKQLDSAAVIYQIVLTKLDKLKPSDVPKVIETTLTVIRKHPAAHPELLATSSETGTGVEDLRAEIARLAPAAA
ncbi:MAG: ribosome biogenesis GTP-binding protein YihA/YsxC [Hyphomonadaceae bacterium]